VSAKWLAGVGADPGCSQYARTGVGGRTGVGWTKPPPNRPEQLPDATARRMPTRSPTTRVRPLAAMTGSDDHTAGTLGIILL